MMSFTRWLRLSLAAALCGGLALLPPVSGGEKGGKKGEAKKTVESKGEQRTAATTVDFPKALELDFPLLTGLGARIEQARDQADPVGLAAAARELAVAEEVSGKQAAVKSAELFKEAIELAKNRAVSAELKAVARLAGKAAEGKELLALAKKAADQEAKDLQDRKSGIKTRGIMGRLHVDSRVNAFIRVYVDGRYVGSMGPMGDIYPWIGQTARETTFLSARSSSGRSWSNPVSRAVGDYRWTLVP
jgi:hypothetical protein